MPGRYDTVAFFQTPEGVELSLTVAGPLVRGCAWTIDFCIRVTCYIIISLILQLFGGVGDGVMLISLFLIEWFYPVAFEVRNGMTPGKKAMGLIVVHDNGTPIGPTSSLLRNLIRCIDFLPLFNVLGLITMVLNPRFKRLGDIAAGSLVIYRTDLTRKAVIPEATPKPSPIPLRLEEQRHILDFCERSGDLSPSRKLELARILAEIAGKIDPDRKLLQYGNWFLRGRGHDESTPV